jgi:hypothetical protein
MSTKKLFVRCLELERICSMKRYICGWYKIQVICLNICSIVYWHSLNSVPAFPLNNHSLSAYCIPVAFCDLIVLQIYVLERSVVRRMSRNIDGSLLQPCYCALCIDLLYLISGRIQYFRPHNAFSQLPHFVVLVFAFCIVGLSLRISSK